MLEFRIKNIVPPGQDYFYEVEGEPLVSRSRAGLVAKIEAAYQALGSRPPADIWARVEDFMCRRLPEGFCTGSDDGKPRARVLTIQQLRTGTEQEVARSTGKAPPALVRMRAETCNRCRYNNRAMCPTCSGINQWAARRVGSPSVPASFNWLGVCEVSGTALVAKVHLEGLRTGDGYPEECWLHA